MPTSLAHPLWLVEQYQGALPNKPMYDRPHDRRLRTSRQPLRECDAALRSHTGRRHAEVAHCRRAPQHLPSSCACVSPRIEIQSQRHVFLEPFIQVQAKI